MSQSTVPNLNVLNVLVVEDVDPMRELLKEALGRADGIRLSGAVRNTWEARREVLRRRPDLVLLDEVLPGESSVDFLQELVADGMAVVMMTGMDEREGEIPEGALARVFKPGWDTLEADSRRLRNALRAAWQAHEAAQSS